MNKKGEFVTVFAVVITLFFAAAIYLSQNQYDITGAAVDNLTGNATNQTRCNFNFGKISENFNFSKSEPRLSYSLVESQGIISVYDTQGNLFWSTPQIMNITDMVVKDLNCDASEEIIFLTKQGGFYVFDLSGSIIYSEQIDLMLAFGSMPYNYSCYADRDCGGSEFDIRNYSLSQLSENGWDENEWTKNGCGYPILKNVGGDQEFC